MLINKNDGVQEGRSAQDNPINAPDLPQEAPSTASIADIFSTVNTDRIRFFNKESLSGNDVQLSTGGEMTVDRVGRFLPVRFWLCSNARSFCGFPEMMHFFRI